MAISEKKVDGLMNKLTEHGDCMWSLTKPLKKTDDGVVFQKNRFCIVSKRISPYIGNCSDDVIKKHVSFKTKYKGCSKTHKIKIKNAESLIDKHHSYESDIQKILNREFDYVGEDFKRYYELQNDLSELTPKEIIEDIESEIDAALNEFDEIMAKKSHLDTRYLVKLINLQEYKEYVSDLKRIESSLPEIRERAQKEFEEEVKNKLALQNKLVNIMNVQALFTDDDRKMLYPTIEVGADDQKYVEVMVPRNKNKGTRSLGRGSYSIDKTYLDLKCILLWLRYKDYNSYKTRFLEKHYLVFEGDSGGLYVQRTKHIWGYGSIIDKLEPAEITNAKSEGRKVIRYGQIFFKEMKRTNNMKQLEGTKYEASKSGNVWTITHPELDDLKLEGLWKAVPMKGEIYY